MSEKRQPWMKWYPADWRADPKLRMCSMTARGVWIEMLGFMHEAEPYGHLIVGGIAPNEQQLAVLIGTTPAIVRKAVGELEAANVFSRDLANVIFSRRMVRDKAKSDADRENGSGGGNPKLRAPVNQTIAVWVNPPLKAQKLEARDQKPEETSLRSVSARSTRGRPKTSLPSDWKLSQIGLEYAKSKGYDVAWIAREAEAFRDHAVKNDCRYANWEAAWRTWVQNAPKFAGNSRGNGHVNGTGPATAIARGFAEAVDELERDRGPGRPSDGPLLVGK